MDDDGDYNDVYDEHDYYVQIGHTESEVVKSLGFRISYINPNLGYSSTTCMLTYALLMGCYVMLMLLIL